MQTSCLSRLNNQSLFMMACCLPAKITFHLINGILDHRFYLEEGWRISMVHRNFRLFSSSQYRYRLETKCKSCYTPSFRLSWGINYRLQSPTPIYAPIYAYRLPSTLSSFLICIFHKCPGLYSVMGPVHVFNFSYAIFLF